MSILKRVIAGSVVALAPLAGTPADAHHSVQAVVDTSQRLQAEMVLTKVDWINPHTWFHFSLAKPDGGVIKDVQIEWLSLGAMRQAGIAGPQEFSVGQTYHVVYNPNRDGSAGGEVVSLVDEATGRTFSRGGGDQPPPQAPPQRPSPFTRISD
jgi:hypothetical protein